MKLKSREDLSDFLKSKAALCGMSLELIATKIGVTKESVANGMSQSRSCSNQVLIKISKVVGFEMSVIETELDKYFTVKPIIKLKNDNI